MGWENNGPSSGGRLGKRVTHQRPTQREKRKEEGYIDIKSRLLARRVKGLQRVQRGDVGTSKSETSAQTRKSRELMGVGAGDP